MHKLLMPRGIRNHNPGNIRLSPTRWQGQKDVQADTSFAEFTSPLMGLRALMRLLLTYHFKYGLNSVESIINRWAPPHENATDHYIHSVSRHLRVERRAVIDLTDEETLIKLAEAITRHENGRAPAGVPAFWYEASVYADAAAMLQEHRGKQTTLNQTKATP